MKKRTEETAIVKVESELIEVADVFEKLGIKLTEQQYYQFVRMEKQISDLTIRDRMLEKETSEMSRKIKESPEAKKLKELKTIRKQHKKNQLSVLDSYNGALAVILADFMPGKRLSEKRAAVENEARLLTGRAE